MVTPRYSGAPCRARHKKGSLSKAAYRALLLDYKKSGGNVQKGDGIKARET